MDLPYSTSENFKFSNLYLSISDNSVTSYDDYPFSSFKKYFAKASELTSLNLEFVNHYEEFKPIKNRNDYFYFIAHKYFHGLGVYNYSEKRDLLRQGFDEQGNVKIQSFFNEIYRKIDSEYKEQLVKLKQEYILSDDKTLYINKLVKYLFLDFNKLEDALRKNQNVFTKFGYILREFYIKVFNEIFSQYIDFVDDSHFTRIRKLLFPTSTKVKSFTFKKDLTDEAFVVVVKHIYEQLRDNGYIAYQIDFKAVSDLFSNKRRVMPQIVWQRDLTALFTFYKIMERDNIIHSTNNQHWKVLSDYFVLKNEFEIKPDELKGKKLSTKSKIVDELEECFSVLRNIKVVKKLSPKK